MWRASGSPVRGSPGRQRARPIPPRSPPKRHAGGSRGARRPEEADLRPHRGRAGSDRAARCSRPRKFRSSPPAAQPAAGEVPGGRRRQPDPRTRRAGPGHRVQTGLPTVDEPPPLPLPPAGEQGSLGNKSAQRIAAASAQPEQGSTAPPPAAGHRAAHASRRVPPFSRRPRKQPPTGRLLFRRRSGNRRATPPHEPQPSRTAAARARQPPPPPKKKPAAAKKKPPGRQENLGAEPVVLVPPSKTVVRR